MKGNISVCSGIHFNDEPGQNVNNWEIWYQMEQNCWKYRALDYICFYDEQQRPRYLTTCFFSEPETRDAPKEAMTTESAPTEDHKTKEGTCDG